jgi:hypothetical protein
VEVVVKAVVVYESIWGNTAAVAAAIADGLGTGSRAVSTSEATADSIADADLIVVGSPVLGFSLPTDRMLDGIRANPGFGAPPPDLSHPSMRSWLAGVARETGRPDGPPVAAFETGLRWSPGSAANSILKELGTAGFRPLGKGRRFVVTGKYGPLRGGEVDRAREWGTELARLVEAAGS